MISARTLALARKFAPAIRSGVVYLVTSAGEIEVLDWDEYETLTVERLLDARVALTHAEAAGIVAEMRGRS